MTYQVSGADADVEKVRGNVELIGLVQLGGSVLAPEQGAHVGGLGNLRI
jgi:hypothetical protein